MSHHKGPWFTIFRLFRVPGVIPSSITPSLTSSVQMFARRHFQKLYHKVIWFTWYKDFLFCINMKFRLGYIQLLQMQVVTCPQSNSSFFLLYVPSPFFCHLFFRLLHFYQFFFFLSTSSLLFSTAP